jgi:DNA-binding CsgD family transcriptional regulator
MNELEKLLIDISTATALPEVWPLALAGVARITHSRELILQSIVEDRDEGFSQVLIGSTHNEADLSAYQSWIDEVGDPRMDAAFQTAIGCTYQDHDFISEADMRKHPFYTEFLHRLDMKYVAGLPAVRYLSRQQETRIGFGLQRSPRQGPMQGDDLRIWNLLTEHLVRAVQVSYRTGRFGHRDGSDDVPRFSLGQKGVCQNWNTGATRLLSERQVLLDANGRIVFLHPMLNRLYQRTIERWIKLIDQGFHPAPARIRSADIELVLTLLPAKKFEYTEADAACDLIELTLMTQSSSSLTAKLTDAEERVVDLLEVGLTTRSIASRLDLGYETIRTHLKHAMAKMGVHTQVALVAKRLAQRRKRASV